MRDAPLMSERERVSLQASHRLALAAQQLVAAGRAADVSSAAWLVLAADADLAGAYAGSAEAEARLQAREQALKLGQGSAPRYPRPIADAREVRSELGETLLLKLGTGP